MRFHEQAGNANGYGRPCQHRHELALAAAAVALPAPAIIATVFNLMEADGLGVLKSLFPLLLLSTLVCSVAWWKSRKAES